MSAAGSSLLEAIVQKKWEEVRHSEAKCTVSPLDQIPSFHKALLRSPKDPLRVIAESKKASPSRGLIRPDYDPSLIARTYRELGASAISVLTDREFFSGGIDDISLAKQAGLPILRKDFIVHKNQITTARNYGASAVLLIVRILDDRTLLDLLEYAISLELDVLVETHNEREVLRAMDAGANIIGINHRDLDTLQMDLSLSAKLAPLIRSRCPECIVVAESGVETREGILKMEQVADAVLIGSALMESADISSAWNKLFFS